MEHKADLQLQITEITNRLKYYMNVLKMNMDGKDEKVIFSSFFIS